MDIVRYSGSPLFLSVFQPYGPGGQPGKGYAYASGSEVVLSVPAVMETNGWQVACEGWTGTGSVPASGNGSSVTFAIAEHSTLEWKWGSTNVWISCPLTGTATADFSEGWIPLGGSVTLTWTPTEDGTEPNLYGDTDGVVLDAVNHTVAIPADRPRSLSLVVAVPTYHTEETPFPVPYGWLERYSNALVTPRDYEALASSIAYNGRPYWECYVADLDPTNAASDLVAGIEMENGAPRIFILKGESPDRTYRYMGATALGSGATTGDVTNVSNLLATPYRFFWIEVVPPVE